MSMVYLYDENGRSSEEMHFGKPCLEVSLQYWVSFCRYRMLSRPYAFGCILRVRTSPEFKAATVVRAEPIR
jgi:hypothetical protein